MQGTRFNMWQYIDLRNQNKILPERTL